MQNIKTIANSYESTVQQIAALEAQKKQFLGRIKELKGQLKDFEPPIVKFCDENSVSNLKVNSGVIQVKERVKKSSIASKALWEDAAVKFFSSKGMEGPEELSKEFCDFVESNRSEERLREVKYKASRVPKDEEGEEDDGGDDEE